MARIGPVCVPAPGGNHLGKNADAIIAWLGAHGSAAAYHLAKLRKRVIGLDKFRPPHDRGSSHGGSRIIPLAFHGGPVFVPLVQRSLDLWQELERESRAWLLNINGGGMMVLRASGGRAGLRRFEAPRRWARSSLSLRH